jgi:glycosyltransferase involved in cell wall biosynthesis
VRTRARDGLVSVVVVNHDYGRFLEAAIDSALGQSHAATEVIVVDDGSTDDSRDRIAGYRDRVVPVFKENGGQASAFNAGFEASRGEVVLFLDADDLLLPAAAETAALCLSDGEAVKVHWRLWQIDETGRRTGRRYPEQPVGAGDLREHVIRHGPNSYVSPPTSGNAWTRAYLEKVLPVRECGDKHGADAYLSMLAPLHGPIRRTEPQSCYRVHPGNFSGRSVLDRIAHDLRRYQSYCEIMRDHLGRMGRSVDRDAWNGPGSVHAWMEGVRAGTGEIAAVVPRGDTLILADDAQWGGGGAIAGRRCLPFLERDGGYWGPPADSETAVSELERLRRCGATFMAFASPCFWWLDFYGGLRSHLYSNFDCVMENERVIVFDLRPRLRPSLAEGV